MADDHAEDGEGAATRTFVTTMVGAVLFIGSCLFILL